MAQIRGSRSHERDDDVEIFAGASQLYLPLSAEIAMQIGLHVVTASYDLARLMRSLKERRELPLSTVSHSCKETQNALSRLVVLHHHVYEIYPERHPDASFTHYFSFASLTR